MTFSDKPIRVLAISDITLDHVAKELDLIADGRIYFQFCYEEDVVGKLLSITPSEYNDIDVLFIHSDQVFHNRPQEWQKLLCNTLSRFSAQMADKAILVSNSLTDSFKTYPLKVSFGNSFDTANIYSTEIKGLLERSNIFVFDFQSIIKDLGKRNFYNYTLGHLYQMPYTKEAIQRIAQKLAEQISWLFNEEKKVIAVDCDNTLWKGVIGEDGVQGIRCDKDTEGIIHYHFQEFLKIKKDEGFLLCICSKNNEQDVKEAFEKKNFVLKWDDFIIRKINWNDKVTNLNEIAEELNVGVDSFIFVDDNKFELEHVSGLLPGVACMQFTEDYKSFLTLIDRFEFKKRQVLNADVEKTEQYKKLQQRNSEGQNYENLDEFIENLQIRMDIKMNDLAELERLSQLTGKTNQFNFNKQPYSSEQLNNFIVAGGRLYSLSVSDKYGDYGTIGLIMLQPQYQNELILENFLMSCRALGKKIEDRFLQYVLQELEKNNLKIKSVKFVKTDKNVPAENFYNKVKNETINF